jgi:hypothetical protein
LKRDTWNHPDPQSGKKPFRRLRARAAISVDRKPENQQNGDMKTTVELPDGLVKQVKLRAVRNGQKLQETIAELLRTGLSAQNRPRGPVDHPVIRRDPDTGLPVIQCRQSASASEELTPDRVAEILSDQEVEFFAPRR